VSAAPRDNNIMVWDAVILGHQGTPLEDGVFELSLHFGEDYPYEPPTIRFVTELLHPNIGEDGQFHLLKWSPAHMVSTILTSIQSTLHSPDLDHSVNSTAAKLYRENKREYDRRVRLRM